MTVICYKNGIMAADISNIISKLKVFNSHNFILKVKINIIYKILMEESIDSILDYLKSQNSIQKDLFNNVSKHNLAKKALED